MMDLMIRSNGSDPMDQILIHWITMMRGPIYQHEIKGPPHVN